MRGIILLVLAGYFATTYEAWANDCKFVLARTNVFVHRHDADLADFLGSQLSNRALPRLETPVFAARIERFADALRAIGADADDVQLFTELLDTVRLKLFDSPVLGQVADTLEGPDRQNLILVANDNAVSNHSFRGDQFLRIGDPINDHVFTSYAARVATYLKERKTPIGGANAQNIGPMDMLKHMNNPEHVVSVRVKTFWDGSPLTFPSSSSFHELVHWNDEVFIKRWLEANKKLHDLGRATDPLFQKWCRFQDGYPIIPVGFHSIYTELRAYEVTAFLASEFTPDLSLSRARELAFSSFLLDQLEKGHDESLKKLGIIPADFNPELPQYKTWLLPNSKVSSTTLTDRVLPLIEGDGSLYSRMNQTIRNCMP